MKKLFARIIFFILALVGSTISLAQGNPSASEKVVPRATAEQTVALVKKGVAYYKMHGRAKALAAFNDPKGEFVKNELYFFVYGTNGEGIVLAHGQQPRMIGKNVIEMQDSRGFYIIREGTKVANSPEGHGWIEYMWPNSMTKTLEPKKSYIEKVDTIWIGCGYYLDVDGKNTPMVVK